MRRRPEAMFFAPFSRRAPTARLRQVAIALGLPLDREPHTRLVRDAIAWRGPERLHPHDYDHIALQLTGHANAVAAEVRHRCAALPLWAEPRVLAELLLEEAERRLGQPRLSTARCVQMRARQLRALYDRLDHLTTVSRGPEHASRCGAHAGS
ncbi:restriction endonuclease [Streptomyces tubercidicus]|uniref:restriction endonuclease n=1 Tax=Streptomyces tubercidicus TaxID=47759 RepID=UPI00346593BE